jgi:hypothetical protein
MTRRKPKPPFEIGDVVVSTYRVPPFLMDELLIVKGLTNIGTKTRPHWRVFVRSAFRKDDEGNPIEGFLDADTLERVYE